MCLPPEDGINVLGMIDLAEDASQECYDLKEQLNIALDGLRTLANNRMSDSAVREYAALIVEQVETTSDLHANHRSQRQLERLQQR